MIDDNELTVDKDPLIAAETAGLQYVTDDIPGIRREKVGEEFQYIGPTGKKISKEEELKRIRSLAIPPAYTDVWICPLANGHIQATARDAKGRKQYRYHPRWREVRDETKYTRMLAFGEALPKLRERVEHDLSLPGLSREKVLATVVRLLETTLIRVGNTEYAKTNKSFGLTTMRDRHVAIEGSHIKFHFRGKSGVNHDIDINDRRLARIVKKCRDIPGYELFQYIDEQGQRQNIGSADVNAYLREVTGQDFTAKDFRTWAGTVMAALALQELTGFEKESQAKKNVVQAIERVAEKLGNTPAVCRKCYIHPAVIDSYLEGAVIETLQQRADEALAEHELRPEEVAVMELLQRRLQQEKEHDQSRDAKNSA